MRLALRGLAGLLALLVVVVLGRATTLTSRQLEVEPAPPHGLDERWLAERLGAALRFPTISNQGAVGLDEEAFLGLRAYLEETFPAVHRALERELVAEWTLLYRWEGRDASRRPILLAAHQDVVPIDPGSEENWREPPFSGAVSDDKIWGRGALDDKGTMIPILEAVERLVAEGWSPPQTVYLAFGHDEEVRGFGAEAVGQLLGERGIELDLVLDEGGAVTEGVFPGFEPPLALVGIAEKGSVSLELVAHAAGGHSSLPDRETAVSILAAGIDRLVHDRPPARLEGAMESFLEALAAEYSFLSRVVVANLWLFRPLVVQALAMSPTTDAGIRTTTAPTILQAGIKSNVLPARARGVVNFRILPGDTIESVKAHAERVVDDPRIEISITGVPRNPSPISRTDTPAWATLSRAIREVFPGAVVTPYLVFGGTDSRMYTGLSSSVYRFSPFVLDAERRALLHGTNEHIGVSDYARVVHFYDRLLRRLDEL